MIVGRLGLIICLLQLLFETVPPFHLPFMRAAMGLVVSVSFVVAAAWLIGELSVVWQVGLQSIAASGLVFGAILIYVSLRRDSQGLLGGTGMIGVSSLSLGAMAALLMRYLQRIPKPHDPN